MQGSTRTFNQDWKEIRLWLSADLPPLNRDLQAASFADNTFFEVASTSIDLDVLMHAQFVRKLATEHRAADAMSVLQRVGRLRYSKQMELLGGACLFFAHLGDFAHAQAVLDIAAAGSCTLAPAILTEYTGMLLRDGAANHEQQAVRLPANCSLAMC